MTTLAMYHNDEVMHRWSESEHRKLYERLKVEPFWRRWIRRLRNQWWKFDPPQINLSRYANGVINRYLDNCIDEHSLHEWLDGLDDIIKRVEANGGTWTNREFAIHRFERMYQRYIDDCQQ